jgi:hypothetical protein
MKNGFDFSGVRELNSNELNEVNGGSFFSVGYAIGSFLSGLVFFVLGDGSNGGEVFP